MLFKHNNFASLSNLEFIAEYNKLKLKVLRLQEGQVYRGAATNKTNIKQDYDNPLLVFDAFIAEN